MEPVRELRKVQWFSIAALCLIATACLPVPLVGKTAGPIEPVVYSWDGGPRNMQADIYHPKGGGGRGLAPGVLLLHGGGPTGSGGRWQMTGIARKLAQRGYVVMNATYRTIPEYHYPVPEEDVKEALHWMREHAAQHGIDRCRIAVFGYSSGGYLGSLTGLKDSAGKDRIKAIVAGGAPSDLTFYALGNLVPQYLGGRLYEVPERFYDASPANFVNRNSPPMFMYHGTRDQLVRPEHPLLMQAAYQRVGAKCRIRWIEGLGHISAFVFSGPAVDEAIDFLDREMR